MPDTLGFPEAARALGVPVRVLRHAIRAGRIPAPADNTAPAPVSDEWLAAARNAVDASPKALTRTLSQKVPAFARYEGTSAWRKYPRRVREFNSFRAAQEARATV